MLSVAPLATVKMPPDVARLAVKVERASVPPLTVRSPLIATLAPRVAVAVPLTVKLPVVVSAVVPVADSLILKLPVTVVTPVIVLALVTPLRVK